MQASFCALKRESDLFLVLGGANIAQAVNTISGTRQRPEERLLSGLGWLSLVAAGGGIVAVTWFVVYVPI